MLSQVNFISLIIYLSQMSLCLTWLFTNSYRQQKKTNEKRYVLQKYLSKQASRSQNKMKTSDLIEKRRSQYNLILNWLRTDTDSGKQPFVAVELLSTDHPLKSPPPGRKFYFKPCGEFQNDSLANKLNSRSEVF
jgi:hypothetical protein